MNDDFCDFQIITVLTGFQLLCRYGIVFWGVLFGGAYLPQKMDLLPPLERDRNSVQKHVLSYQVEISEGCCVWAAPTLQTGAIIKNRKQTV
jgi:hypothetical protein